MNFEIGDRILVNPYGNTETGYYVGACSAYPQTVLVCLDPPFEGWPITSDNLCGHTVLRNRVACFGFTERLWWVSLRNIRSAA